MMKGSAMPAVVRVMPVRVQMTTESQNGAVDATRACCTLFGVLAGAAAMADEPMPASLEKRPRRTPTCMASMMVEPTKPPAAA